MNATCETDGCGVEVDQEHLDELRISNVRHDIIQCQGCLNGERQEELLDAERTRNEAREMASMLQQYVTLALATGSATEDVNAYLLEVRNFMFRLRPAAIRTSRALEVVR